MKERSAHDKCLINKCLSCCSFLSDMVAHTFVIQKFNVRGGGGREVQSLFVTWLSRWMILSPTCVGEDMYHSSVAAFAKGFEQLESPACWHRTDLPSEMTHFKKDRRMKSQVYKTCISSCNKET